MSEIQEHVACLSRNIGPRPAGTEEEQQAALYLFDTFRRDVNLPVSVEEFNCSPNFDIPRMLCCALTVIAAVLCIFLPVLVIPALILTILTAVLYVLEVFDLSLFRRFLQSGISQNVIAKYVPETTSDPSKRRRRKIVLVAHYDSGKIRRSYRRPFIGLSLILKWAELCAMIVVPVVLFIELVSGAGDVFLLVLNILLAIGAVLAVFPVIAFVIKRLTTYNEAANCNAAGVAVMLEAAERIVQNRVGESASPLGDGAVLHGEQAARASGYVPGGAEFVYEADENYVSPDASPEERLNSAKAALAAFTGSSRADIAGEEGFSGFEEGAGSNDGGMQQAGAEEASYEAASGQGSFDANQAAAENAEPSSDAAAGQENEAFEPNMPRNEAQAAEGAPLAGQSNADSADVHGEASTDAEGKAAAAQGVAAAESTLSSAAASEGVPSWFTTAQEKAKKTPEGTAPAQRSRYADSLNDAVRESSAYFSQANKAVSSETELRLQQMRDNIMEVKAPSFEDLDFSGAESMELFPEGAAAGEAAGTAGEVTGAVSRTGEAASEAAGAASAVFPEGAAVEEAAGAAPQAGAAVGEAAGAAGEVTAAVSQAGEAATAEGDATVENVSRETFEVAAEQQGDAGNAAVFAASADASESAEDIAAAADRTIAFIPVPIDEDALFNKPSAQDERGVDGAASPSSRGAAGVGEAVDAAPHAANTSGLEGTDASAATAATDGTGASAAAQADTLQGFVVPRVFSGNEKSQEGASQGATPRKGRSLNLPGLTGSLGTSISSVPASEEAKQRAPLADDAMLTHDRSEQLRELSLSDDDAVAANTRKRQATQGGLRSALPSLTGSITAEDYDRYKAAIGESADAAEAPAAQEEASSGGTSNVSQIGSFGAIGATGAFAPVGDELVEGVDPQDMYVDDADDSEYEEKFTETGAFAGPGYVDMPESRASRFFGRFRRGRADKQEETTTQQWLDVDENFEAREVGKARGSWESFREDAAEDGSAGRSQADRNAQDRNAQDRDSAQDFDDMQDYGNRRFEDDDFDDDASISAFNSWEGGAFSRSASASAEGYTEENDRKYGEEYGEKYEEEYAEEYDEEYGQGYGDEYDARYAGEYAEGYGEGYADAEYGAVPEERGETSGTDEPYADDVQRIQAFRHFSIGTEVWFVALGAELAENGGMKALLANHGDELKGSIFIELEGLGAGDLTLIEREGTYRSVKSSSRIKRAVRKATSALGMRVGTGALKGRSGAAAYAIRSGYQATHLAGIDAGKPAYCDAANDVVENVSEDMLLASTDFVIELLRNA